MTNARVSKKAWELLRNKPLARAVSNAFANGHGFYSEYTTKVKIDDIEYIIKISPGSDFTTELRITRIE